MMTSKIFTFVFLTSLSVMIGCISHESIASLNDKLFFEEGPELLICEGRYFVRFRYSTERDNAFFMMTWSHVDDGKLIFYLPVTTSSGRRNGRIQFEEIVSLDKIDLINKGSVFWREPNNHLIPLRVVNSNLDIKSVVDSCSNQKH